MSDTEHEEEDLDIYSTTSIELPKLKKWSQSTYYDFESEIVDYESLEKLNRSVNAARLALFKVAEMTNNYERLEREARLKYDRAYRREYLASTAKTETAKKARAELKCEDLENEYIAHEQVKIELMRMSNTLRLELQTLQAVGNNLRQQIKME